MAIDLKKAIMPAVLITAAVLLVGYIMSMVGYPVAPLYSSIGPVSAVSGTAGQKVLAWIGGIIPIDTSGILTMATLYLFVSAFLIWIVGGLVISMLKLPVMKGKTGEIATRIIYGTAVFYLLIVGPVLAAWGVLAGLAIHTLIVAFVVGFLGDKLKIAV